MRVNILCAGKVLGTAIGSAGNITYEANPGRFDRLATLEEAKAHCAEFNARGYGQPRAFDQQPDSNGVRLGQYSNDSPAFREGGLKSYPSGTGVGTVSIEI